jgi:hypothetical protein
MEAEYTNSIEPVDACGKNNRFPGGCSCFCLSLGGLRAVWARSAG